MTFAVFFQNPFRELVRKITSLLPPQFYHGRGRRASRSPRPGRGRRGGERMFGREKQNLPYANQALSTVQGISLANISGDVAVIRKVLTTALGVDPFTGEPVSGNPKRPCASDFPDLQRVYPIPLHLSGLCANARWRYDRASGCHWQCQRMNRVPRYIRLRRIDP